MLIALCLAASTSVLLRCGGEASAVPPVAKAARPLPLRQPPTTIAAATPVAVRIAAAEIAFPAASSAAVVPLEETLVYGSLLDASGLPVRGAAAVAFVDRAGGRSIAEANHDGAYAMHASGSGTCWVTASADGYRSLQATIELCPDQPVLQRNFTLQPLVALAIVVLTPEGRDLSAVLKQAKAPLGASILLAVATREPPGKRFEVVAGSTTGRSGLGHFQGPGTRVEQLPSGCIGILVLDGDLPVCVSLLHFQAVLQTQRVDRGQQQVTFVLAAEELLANLATISARVVDASTARPIAGARMRLCGGTYSDQGVATDPQGIATIALREPGRFDLQVWARGHAGFAERIDAPPGGTTDLGTVFLENEVAVAGHVVDLDGYPLAASFALGAFDPADQSIHWLRHQGFRSRGDGAFQISGLGRGQYAIRSLNHDAVDRGAWEGVAMVSGNQLFDTRDGPIPDLAVRVRPASKLVLRGAADGTRFRVVDERGLELVGGRISGAQPRPLALPAGSYRVSLLAPEGAVLSVHAVTLAAATVELDLAHE